MRSYDVLVGGYGQSPAGGHGYDQSPAVGHRPPYLPKRLQMSRIGRTLPDNRVPRAEADRHGHRPAPSRPVA